MAYWSFEQRVSEDDVIHYGRKGMKWYQHIFGDKTSIIKKNKVHRKEKKEKNKTKYLINRNTRLKQLGVIAGATIALGAEHIKHYYGNSTSFSQYSDRQRNIMIGAAAITAILEGRKIYHIYSFRGQQGS